LLASDYPSIFRDCQGANAVFDVITPDRLLARGAD